MNTGRNILLVCIMLFIPIISYAQVPRLKPKEEPRKKVILSSGDTTVVVNKVSEGLNGKDAEFLYRDLRFVDESIFPDEDTKYKSLEEAAYDVNRLMNMMQNDSKRDRSSKTNRSLAYRASQVERIKNESEQAARSKTDSLLKKEDTEKLVKLYEKFGNSPTYFLNGLEVNYTYIESLYPDEILSRSIKVVNTVSGNPNGEIWYKVPDKVLLEIGLVKLDASGNPYIVNDDDEVPTVKDAQDALKLIKIGK